MAWNEPGGGKDKDPWGSRNKQDGPPDLDELVQKMKSKFGGIFGGKKGGGDGRIHSPSPFGLGLVIVVLFIGWILSGIYIVNPAEQGVVLRFGKYQETVEAGPHWHIPYPIENVLKVNVKEIRTIPAYKAQMLTKDQNLIRIDLTVQYQVKSAENFLFKVNNPEYTFREATESALRDVVGGNNMDEMLSEGGGRSSLVIETKKQLQSTLDKYATGLKVIKVNLENIKAPKEVQAAFDDAINAEEDEDRYKKQAEAYENDIIPKAEGDAERLEQEAQAYKQQVIDKSKGEASRFLQTYKEYKKAPEITRKRLYLETMEAVLSNSSKVLIKMSQGNSIMYLPLDRIINQTTRTIDPALLEGEANNNSSTTQGRTPNRSDIRRSREGR